MRFKATLGARVGLHLHAHHIVVYSIQRQARIFKWVSMFVARLLNLSTA